MSDIADTVSGLFSTLADAMPQMVWATDADGSHFYYNRRWYEYTGMTEADSMGFGFAVPLHPDDHERTLERWRQARDAGEDYDIEYRFRRRDGVYRWFVGRATAIRDVQTGNVRMWVGTCTDIDDSRRAFETLAESQGRLSLALRTARLGTWEYDYATQTFDFSPRTQELFGLADAAVPFARWSALLHEEDQERVVAAATAIIEQTPPYEADDAIIRIRYRARRPDHTVRHLLVMGARLFDADGKAVRIAGVAQDVTEERNTLDALRESAEALRESESRLRSVIGNAQIVVFALDRDGVFTFSDGAGLAAIGLQPGQVVGRTVWEIYAGEPELLMNLRLALAGESVTWINTINGVTFEIKCTPLTDDTGTPNGLIGVAFDITDKARAAAELAAREEQYRFLFRTVASGVVYQDENAYILDANPAAERILGMSLAQMQGRDSLDPRWKAVREDGTAFPGEEHPVPVALRTGQTVRDVPMGVYHPAEDRYRWLSVTAVPLLKPGARKPHLVYAYFEDRTEARKAEESLRESESRFRDLADNISQLAWMTDDTGWIFWYNQRWFDYTGTSLEEMQGWGWQKVHHPDHVGRVTEKFADHIRRGAVWEDTFPIRGASGAYRWFLSRAVPLRDATGKIVRWFGTNTDITESRHADEEVRRSEERFRSLITATAQIVWTTRANGAFRSEQPGWAAFTGQSPDGYKGAGWLDAVHEDDRGDTAARWQEAVATHETFMTEHRLRRADGTFRYMLVRAVPVLEAGGAVREWIGVHTDITERKEVEFALSEYATKQARVAETLQRSLLNTPPSRAFPGIAFSMKYEPALDEAQVGGDFFDLFALAGGRVALVVGDVTGKGLKAAEHTGQIKYALRAFLRENPDPADALSRVNRLLNDTRLLDVGITDANEDNTAMAAATVVVLNPATGALVAAGGGAEYPLVYRSRRGVCEEVSTSGLVVGAYAESIYEASESRLEEGDLLILTTDGITEARRGKREFFGNEGVAGVVEAVVPKSDAPDSVAVAIIEAARNYSASGAFRDDVCLVVLRRDRVSISLPPVSPSPQPPPSSE